MAAYQAYIDDSRAEGGTFVLAGHVASADAWEDFSREWEQMLPLGLRDENGFHFKMSEMAYLEERMARVPGFYRIIEKHVLFSISCKIEVSELERARRRICIPRLSGSSRVVVDWGAWYNPYTMAFRGLLDMFNSNREEVAELLPPNEPVDFIFDEQLYEKSE